MQQLILTNAAAANARNPTKTMIEEDRQAAMIEDEIIDKTFDNCRCLLIEDEICGYPFCKVVLEDNNIASFVAYQGTIDNICGNNFDQDLIQSQTASSMQVHQRWFLMAATVQLEP
uniref:Uncharacterized protein n=1 Tax=Romanomermis culicivorax TaxID=13658 RepID=A0A915IWD4_ROMCU